MIVPEVLKGIGQVGTIVVASPSHLLYLLKVKKA